MQTTIRVSLCVGLLALASCSPSGPATNAVSGTTTYPVSGTVTYKGEPVPVGNLHFDPDPRTNFNGVAVSVSIKNGAFATEPNRGLLPGDYIVRVQPFDGKAGNDAPLGQALCEEQTQPYTQPAAKATFNVSLR